MASYLNTNPDSSAPPPLASGGVGRNDKKYMPTKLGQNFLTDESIAERIAKSANLAGKNVLEIGPGKGMLTGYLAKHAGKILAVEIDRNLAAALPSVIASAAKQSRLEPENTELPRTRSLSASGGLPRNDRIKIITGDILKINLPRLIEENNFQDYKVVANLPYYITSKIIRLFLETKYPPREMVLMVQKEVGERIVALDGKESLLSISVKFYAAPEILFEVTKENFDPAPEVDSVVIKISRKNRVPEVDMRNFFSLVHAGFSAKRKMLANNLSSGFKIPKSDIPEILKKAGLNPAVRAEKLSMEDWLMLYEILFE
jgi:16S rRNA (adenine1518-N6/adenine1519-N6)-dimethyltransferase